MSWPRPSRARNAKKTMEDRRGCGQESQEREKAALGCAPASRGSLRGGREPGGCGGSRPDTVPETQVCGRAPTSDVNRSEAGDQHRARRIGPLVIHGQRASAGMLCSMPPMIRSQGGRARALNTGHRAAGTKITHTV